MVDSALDGIGTAASSAFNGIKSALTPTGSVMDGYQAPDDAATHGVDPSSGLGPMRQDFADRTGASVRAMPLADQAAVAQGSGQVSKIAQNVLPQSTDQAQRIESGNLIPQTPAEAADKSMYEGGHQPEAPVSWTSYFNPQVALSKLSNVPGFGGGTEDERAARDAEIEDYRKKLAQISWGDTAAGTGAAALDFVGGVPGFMSGIIGGLGVSALAGHPEEGISQAFNFKTGREHAEEVMQTTTPSEVLRKFGVDLPTDSPSYKVAMLPLDVINRGIEEGTSYARQIAKMASASDATADQIKAGLALGAFAGMAFHGGKAAKERIAPHEQAMADLSAAPNVDAAIEAATRAANAPVQTAEAISPTKTIEQLLQEIRPLSDKTAMQIAMERAQLEKSRTQESPEAIKPDVAEQPVEPVENAQPEAIEPPSVAEQGSSITPDMPEAAQDHAPDADVKALVDMGYSAKDAETLVKQQQEAPEQAQNNASGESAASLEAQSRLASENDAGRQRVKLDTRTGEVTPLVTADRVDATAGQHEAILQKGIGKNEWTVLDQGAGVGNVNAAIERARMNGRLNDVERRVDDVTRKTVSQMSQDEMRQALLTSDKTGIGNERAYNEVIKKPILASIDLDSLGWINDNVGHSAGDQFLRLAGQAIKEVTGDIYHSSGDEFKGHFDSEEHGHAVLGKVRDRLKDAVLEFTKPDGTVVTKKGIGFSYGLDKEFDAADAKLYADKAAREASGDRVKKGIEPAGVSRYPAAWDEANKGLPAAQEEINRKAERLREITTPVSKRVSETPIKSQEESAHTQKLRNSPGWVIREKSTGNVIMETFDRKKVDALNTAKYEAVPTYDHLVELNKSPQEKSNRDQAEPAKQKWIMPEAKLAPVKEKPAVAFSVGRLPNSAEAITVRDGVVHVGKYPAQDFETGKDVKVLSDATPAQIKDALVKAGAIGKGERFFGLKQDGEKPLKSEGANLHAKYITLKAAATAASMRIDKHIDNPVKSEKYADDFFSLSADVVKAEKALATEIIAMPDDRFFLQGHTSDGRMVTLNESAKQVGYWQLTNFDTKGYPAGDTQYSTKAKAVSDFLSDIDIKTLSDADGNFGNAPLFSKALSQSGLTIADVAKSIANLRAKWIGFTKIATVQSIADLPADIRERANPDAHTEALYDPQTKSVHLIADNIASPERAAWVAAHEVIGHGGLRMLRDKTVNEALKIAGQNRFIRDLAKAITQDRTDVSAPVAIEEALAELSAAIETGDFHALAGRYGVDIPAAAQNGVKGMIARVFETVKRFLAAMTGKPIADVSDADVRALIHAQREAVEGGRQDERTSVEGAQGDSAMQGQPLFSKSKIVGDNDRERTTEQLRDKLAAHLQVPKSMLSDLKLMTVPMAEGSDIARKTAKDYANQERKTQWQWKKFDDTLTKNFDEVQLKKMWDAADEENDLRREGVTDDNRGLGRLNQKERAVVETFHAYGEELISRAKENGMFEGEGVPYWTPRMAVMVGESGEYSRVKPSGEGGGSSDGRNITTSASSLKQRKYLTSAETEAAMKARFDEGDKNAQLVRNIRTMPMAMARLERAIAGRELINQIKALGQASGKDTVLTGAPVPGDGFFTINHPAFKTWRPDFKDGEIRKDADGNPVMVQVPLKISDEFKGPLKAVMSVKPGQIYSGLMMLKSKTMGLIMYSPIIHNAVEWGRAIPAMDTKGKLSLGIYTYVIGNRAKNNTAILYEAIDHGLVPIGGRGANLDITGIMDDPSLEHGKSWTAKVLAAPVALISEKGADNVKKAVDAAGKFWHETLLWDRVADLQMGLYISMKTSMINKGLPESDASYIAAHFANRYAGALPRESMSEGARKILNLSLFSRSFTMGNLGAMKDMIAGLPKDVQSQIKLSGGELALQAAQSAAKKKAIATFAIDIGLMYAGNSLLQDWLEREKINGWKGWLGAYADRGGALFDKLRKDPTAVLAHPFNSLESLSSTGSNEPGKEERIKWGEDSTGTEIYVRLPTGKIGEEFAHYSDFPSGTMKQVKAKFSTFLRPLYETITNDKGVGQKVYDDSKDASAAKNVGKVVFNFMKAQIPSDQIAAAYDLSTGHGDDMDIKKIIWPLVGLTFSKGAPGGQAVGEMYQESRDHQDNVTNIMPDVKRAIKLGDEDKALDLMESVNMTPREITTTMNHIENPESRLSKSAMLNFNKHATEEQKDRMAAARN